MRRAALSLVLFLACAGRQKDLPPKPEAQEEAQSCVLPRAERAPDRTDRNVLGAPLASCSTSPMTGVYRDGRCATGASDVGVHVVCAQVTDAFLQFTAARGNDLIHPSPGFPGLKAGDRWCLCASRWAEADAACVAPPVVPEATHERALTIVGRDRLMSHAQTL